jgi:hypothetical protein
MHATCPNACPRAQSIGGSLPQAGVGGRHAVLLWQALWGRHGVRHPPLLWEWGREAPDNQV